MTIRPLRQAPDLAAHTGFLLAEDAALKQYLTGIKVPKRPDMATEEIEVGVWFRFPEGERQIQYPFITIDLLQAEPAFDLFHSEHYYDAARAYRPSVSPDFPPPPGDWTTQNYLVRNYLPFRLLYQVTHYSRSSLHDRYLTSIFITDVFPVRPFWIGVDADNTWRRTEQVGFVAADVPETSESGTKRIFRKVYSISMQAEVPQDRLLDSVSWKILRVLIPVVERERMDQYRQEILDGQPDPINEFTQDERDTQGEYFHIVHEGQEVPTVT